jgi:hypothetical protein
MYSWQHCGAGTLSYRQPRHLVTMDQWNGQQRAVTIKIFYMFGFFKSSHFWGVTLYMELLVKPEILTSYIQSGPKKCIHSLLINIFGINGSPGLTPLDFYLWRSLKDDVYRRKPATLDGLQQRFPNFFQVGTTFISQNVLRTTLLLSPLKANCLRFSTTVCDTKFTLIIFFLSFLD